MATNQTGKPTQLLISRVISGTTMAVDTIQDVNSPWYFYPLTFQVDLGVQIQTFSDLSVNGGFYDASAVEVNDWLIQPSGKAYRISSVISILDGGATARVILEDTDSYVLLNDSSMSGANYPDEEQAGLCIELDNEGIPIIAGVSQVWASLPNLGYWIDDAVSRFEASSVSVVNAVGVNTGIDLDKSPSATINDGDSAGVSITHTPFSDSLVTIKINGMEVNLSDGNKLKECYFSRDGGSSSVLIQDIIAGDTLYWNGSIAGYQLDGTDDLDISYQKSSLD